MRNSVVGITLLLALLSADAFAVSQDVCLRAALSALLNRQQDVARNSARVKVLLDRYFDRGAFTPIEDIEEIGLLKDYFRISESDKFKALPEAVRRDALNDVFAQLAKLPREHRDILAQAGSGLELVVDSVIEHPDVAPMKGAVVDKYRNGAKWDTVRGMSHEGVSIVAGRAGVLQKKTGSRNMVLHEHGHSFETAMIPILRKTSAWSAPKELSKTSEFWDAWRATWWDDYYYRDYPEEAFAESYALFYDSPETRAELKERYRLIYDYFVELDARLKKPLSHAARPTPQNVLTRVRELGAPPSSVAIFESAADRAKRFLPFHDSIDVLTEGETLAVIRSTRRGDHTPLFGKVVADKNGVEIRPFDPAAQPRRLSWDEVGEMYFVKSNEADAQAFARLRSAPWAELYDVSSPFESRRKIPDWLSDKESAIGAEISFTIDGEKSPRTGIVLEYARKDVTYLDLATGEVQTALARDHMRGWVRPPSGTKLQELTSKSRTEFPTGQMGLVTYYDSRSHRAVFGKLDRVTIGKDYHAYQLTEATGTKHVIDPDLHTSERQGVRLFMVSGSAPEVEKYSRLPPAPERVRAISTGDVATAGGLSWSSPQDRPPYPSVIRKDHWSNEHLYELLDALAADKRPIKVRWGFLTANEIILEKTPGSPGSYVALDPKTKQKIKAIDAYNLKEIVTDSSALDASGPPLFDGLMIDEYLGERKLKK